MSKCIVKECGVRCTRFGLPNHEGQRLLWLERSGNKSLDLTKQKHWRICQRHFAPPTFLKLYGGEGKLLKKLALPSLLLPNYTPTGEVVDHFLFPTKTEKPQDTTPKIIKDMLEKFSLKQKSLQTEKDKTQISSYEVKLTEIETILSTSTECKEEVLDGVNPSSYDEEIVDDYTPKMEIIDNHLFPTKAEKPTQVTTPKIKIIKDVMERLSSTKGKHSQMEEAETPISSYELELSEIDTILSTSTECKEEELEYVDPLYVDPDLEIMDDTEIMGETSMEAQPTMKVPFSISSKKKLSRGKIQSFFKEAGPETRGDFYKIMAFIRNVKEKNVDQHDLKYFVQLITEREELLNILCKYSEEHLNLFASNLQNFHLKFKGRRFSQEDKLFALSLYKQSAPAYRYLSKFFSLPTQNSLNQIINKVPSGVDEKIIKQLKFLVSKLGKADRCCVLMFDEISLQPHLKYNVKTHSVDGFVDFGIGRRRLQFADRALVFMVNGIQKPWKQLIYFGFCEGTTPTVDLVRCIKLIIAELQAIDINVIATISDQSTTNQAAISRLVGPKPTGPLIYTVGDPTQEIVHIYDPPHLLEGIRNELLSKDLQYEMDGSMKVARWSHIVDFYQIDQRLGVYKQCSKLTDEHVVPDKIIKNKVSFASQVFSNIVGCAMYARVSNVVECNIQPTSRDYITPQARDTLDLVLFFDKLFDSVNGEVRYPPFYKPLVGAVTRNSDHERVWLNAISTLTSMSFITENLTQVPTPYFRNWISTLHGFCYLRENLLLMTNYFFPRRFNKEPLENWLSQIRSHATGNFNCSSFINSFDASSFSSSHRAEGNCVGDVSTEPVRIFVERQDRFQYLEVDGEISLNTVPEAFCLEFATNYVAETVISEFVRNFPCNSCEELLLLKKIEGYHLVFPEELFPVVFKQVTSNILEVISSIIHKCGVKGIILSELKKKNFTFLLCEEHKRDRQDHLVNIIINNVFSNYIEKVNRVLNGFDTNVINKDGLFRMARNKYFESRKAQEGG